MRETAETGWKIIRYVEGDRDRWGVLEGGRLRALDVGLTELLRLPLAEARDLVSRPVASERAHTEVPRLLAPLDRQEVWAAGVTYRRSLEGRTEESTHASQYDLVYESPRPELFLKSTAARTVGPDEPVGIRADSDWNVPEPEVGLVLNRDLELFALTIGNDMSSRSIEGENALYLPQAKFYDRSCSIGPCLVPAWELGGEFSIALRVEREGAIAFSESTSTGRLARSFDELAWWLGRATSFPDGVILLTGTGIVPGSDFTVKSGDLVAIEVEGIGELRNPVVEVGTAEER